MTEPQLRHRAAGVLSEVLAADTSASIDVPVACVISLGLVPADGGIEEQIAFLLEVAANAT